MSRHCQSSLTSNGAWRLTGSDWVLFFAWHGYPANSERLEVAACLGEEMASSMHNEETGGNFQCPIPSGWSFRLPFRAHLRFRLLRRSRGPRDPAIWRYKSQSPTDTNSKPPDRSQATRFDGGWQVAMLELRHCFSDRRLRCGARVRWNVSSGHINKTWPSLVLWLVTSCQRVTKQLCIYCSKSGKWSHHKSAWNRYSCFGFTQACQSEHNHRVEKHVLLPCLCWRKPQATRKFHEVTKPSSCKHSLTTFQAKGRGFPSLFDSLFHHQLWRNNMAMAHDDPRSRQSMLPWAGWQSCRSSAKNEARQLQILCWLCCLIRVCQPPLFEQLANFSPFVDKFVFQPPTWPTWPTSSWKIAALTKRTVGHWSGPEVDYWSVT